MMARKFGKIHFEDITQSKWNPVENSANILVDQLVTGREFYHLWIALTDIAQQCAANLLSLFLVLGLTRRFLSPHREHVIIVPGEDFLAPVADGIARAILNPEQRNHVIRWLRKFIWSKGDFEKAVRQAEIDWKIRENDTALSIAVADGCIARIDLSMNYRVPIGEYNEFVIAHTVSGELPDFVRAEN
jgi:hypothetical protein